MPVKTKKTMPRLTKARYLIDGRHYTPDELKKWWGESTGKFQHRFYIGLYADKSGEHRPRFSHETIEGLTLAVERERKRFEDSGRLYQQKINPKSLTLDELADKYLEAERRKVGVKHKEGAYLAKVRAYNKHVKRPLGKLYVAKIQYETVQNVIDKIDNETTSVSQTVMALLFNIFKLGNKLKIRLDNPIELVERNPAPRKKKDGFLNGEALVKLFQYLDTLPTDYKNQLRGAIIKTQILTGTRDGELRGLTWDRIDFDTNIITIDRQYSRKNEFDTLKTESSNRVVPLSDELKPVLLAFKKAQMKEIGFKPEGFVFAKLDGRPPKNSSYNLWVKKAMEDSGLPPLNPHDLRRTYISLLYQAGHRIEEISSLVGHSNIDTTRQEYLVIENKALAEKMTQTVLNFVPTYEKSELKCHE